MSRVVALLMVSLAVCAQEPAQEAKIVLPRNETVRKIVEVKHLSGDRADRAVNLVRRFMQPSQVDYDPVLRTVVMIGMPDVVASGEALLRKFDTPGSVRPEAQVQFRLHLVEASPDGDTGRLPTEIAPAVEQMRKTFAYKGYRLMDTLLLQGRGSGDLGASGTLAAPPDMPRTQYSINYERAEVLEDAKTIVVRGFRMNLRVPYPAAHDPKQFNFTDTGVKTDFTITEGQKLVIGKVSSTAAANAIFVIVTADVL